MKTDLNSLKKELKRLADTQYLKKELNRLAAEIKKFDVSAALSTEAQNTLEQLEKRFRELLGKLAELQKQVDASFEKFVKVVRRSGAKKASKTARKAKKSSAKKATKKKTARKTTRKSA